MRFYYYLYCRIYDWYNTTGKKDKDTLRVSAIALLSGLPCFNILTVVFLISLLNQHTFINKWQGILLFGLVLGFNLLLISSMKSDALRSEYKLLPAKTKKKINISFYIYLIFSVLSLFLILGYTAYFKNKYGNYDL